MSAADDFEDWLEQRVMKTPEEHQSDIQQRQAAKPDDFEDLTDINTVKRRAFMGWYPRFYRLPRNAWRRKPNGTYEHDDVRRGFRAFSAGFEESVNQEKSDGKIREAFERWHLTLMPARYAYRHTKKENGSYEYLATEKSYQAFADGHKAGLLFFKENIK